MKQQILTLRPKDYIVFNGGLKIENTSEDLVMEVELPNRYTVSPLEVRGKLTLLKNER